MNAYMQWWDRQPSALRWGVGIAGFLTFYVSFRVLIDRIDQDSYWTGLVLILLLAAALGLISIAVTARRLGGWKQRRLYKRAYRNGVIPDGADLDRWRPLAKRQARYFREGRKVFSVLAAINTVVAILVGAGLWLFDPDLWPGAVAFILLGVVGYPLVRRLSAWRTKQFDRFEAALDRA